MHQVQLRASQLGARLFRNNVGRTRTANGAWLAYGLCKGSADLIGWCPGGRFLAVEVKKPGGLVSSEQVSFINAVNNHGGIAMVATSAEEFEETYVNRLRAAKP
jgi:hypothetical protein